MQNNLLRTVQGYVVAALLFVFDLRLLLPGLAVGGGGGVGGGGAGGGGWGPE